MGGRSRCPIFCNVVDHERSQRFPPAAFVPPGRKGPPFRPASCEPLQARPNRFGACQATPASACFLLRNSACIARGLFARAAEPTLPAMKLHQHQFARETCHERPASRRDCSADRSSRLRCTRDRLRAGRKARCSPAPRERQLSLVGERSLGWSSPGNEPGRCRGIPLVLRNAIPGDHYRESPGASRFW